MADLIGNGLGSPDIWLIPALILGALGILITFNTKVRTIIGTRISIVKERGGVIGTLLVGLAVFLSSSRAYFFRRKMQSDLIGTYGCERSQFYDCRDLIFASSLPIATMWLAASALVIWYIITIVRDSQDNLAITAQNMLPISLFIIAGGSGILLLFNIISNGVVLAPYSLTNIGLLAISGWMIRLHSTDDDAS